MLSEIYYNNFDAYLKLVDGEILAFGKGFIDMEKNAVTFTSSFVPLYPMGTQMEIMRLHKGKKVHSFVGQVYLSGKELMSIISVKDTLFPGSELCYSRGFNFGAKLFDIPTLAKVKKFLPFVKGKAEFIDVVLTELTPDRLHFQFVEESKIKINQRKTVSIEEKMKRSVEKSTFVKDKIKLDKGMEMKMNFSSPLPELSVSLKLIEPFYFGNKPSYSCDVQNISQEDRYKLGKFLWKYNLENNRVFLKKNK